MPYGGTTYDPKTGKWLQGVPGDSQSMTAPLGAMPVQSAEGIPYPEPTVIPAEQPAVSPVAASEPDWAQIAQAYGLGAPPAPALPTVLQPTNIGAAPQTRASLIDTASIPQPVAQQQTIDPRITAMSGGQGYAPDILAKMRAGATQDAASAGLQELSQTKRILGQQGIRGGAAAGVVGDVARRTGQNQNAALRGIDVNNAQVGNENAKFGLGLEANIGQNNMAAANQMALANASAIFSGLKSNQDSQNTTNQMNTGLTFQRQNDQASTDYNTQKSQWDELNKRYGQAQSILGSWGQNA